jgi:rSAM/selenodomain-associated transferase 1
MCPIESCSRIVVFAKTARPGTVKTRLIPLLGAQGASALHARLVEHTLTMAGAAASPGSLQLHVTSVEDAFLRDHAARHGAVLVQQAQGDLGERMHRAFERVFDQDHCTSAVLIGSDCPALTVGHLQQALHAVNTGSDAAFAPAEDGGYVLVALARPNRRLFEDIEWSTGRVMDQTRQRLTEIGWRWHELETLWDVDTPADYLRLVESGLLSPHVISGH